jgi:uncharacterized phiE125 gp8 family phage protein
MATGDLTTLANAKAWLGIANTNEDTLLTRLVTAASQFIQTWLNRDLLSQSYSEIRDGHGGPTLVFRDYPVTAVSSVQVDGYSIPLAGSVLEYGYWFSPTVVTLRGYLFNRGIANVVLSYQAGFSSTPPEIEQACLELVGVKYRERDRIGHASKSLAGEVVAFIVKDMPDSVRSVLNNYKKVIPV